MTEKEKYDQYFLNFDGAARWPVAVSIDRNNSFPLDSNSLFRSYEDAKAYATKDAEYLTAHGIYNNSYVGQIIAVYNVQTEIDPETEEELVKEVTVNVYKTVPTSINADGLVQLDAEITPATTDEYGVVKVSDTLELGSGETGTIVPTVEAVADAISEIQSDRIVDGSARLVVDNGTLHTTHINDIYLSGGSGALALPSGTGEVSIRSGKNAVSIESQSGEVSISSLYKRVSIESQSGEVSIFAKNNALIEASNVSITSYHGNRTVTVSSGSNVDTDAVTFGDKATETKYGVVKVSDTLELGSGETGIIVPTVEAVADAISDIQSDRIVAGSGELVVNAGTLSTNKIDRIQLTAVNGTLNLASNNTNITGSGEVTISSILGTSIQAQSGEVSIHGQHGVSIQSLINNVSIKSKDRTVTVSSGSSVETDVVTFGNTATTTTKGVVQLATSIDSTGNVVPTAAQVKTAIGNIKIDRLVTGKGDSIIFSDTSSGTPALKSSLNFTVDVGFGETIRSYRFGTGEFDDAVVRFKDITGTSPISVSNGKISVADASTTSKGVVQLATSIDSEGNVVPTAAQVKTAIGNIKIDRLSDVSGTGELIVTNGTLGTRDINNIQLSAGSGTINISATGTIGFSGSRVEFNNGIFVTGEVATFGEAPHLGSDAVNDSQAVRLSQVKSLVAGGVRYKEGVAITAVGTDKVTLTSTKGTTSIAVGDMFTITNATPVTINGNTYNAGDSFIATVASNTLTGVAISNFTWINSQDSDVAKLGTDNAFTGSNTFSGSNTFTGTNAFNNAVTFANAPTITKEGTTATSAATYGQITSAIAAVKEEIAGGTVTVATDRIGKKGAELVVGDDASLTTSGMGNIILAPAGGSDTITIGSGTNGCATKILGGTIDIGSSMSDVSIHGTGEITITASGNAAAGNTRNKITFTSHNSNSETRTVTVSTGSNVTTDAVTFGDTASIDKYGVVKVSDTLEVASGEAATIVPTVEAVVDAIGGISQDSITDGTSVILVDTLEYPVAGDIVDEGSSSLRAAALVSNSSGLIIAAGTGESVPSISMWSSNNAYSNGIYNRILLSNQEVNGNGAAISIGGLAPYGTNNEIGDVSIVASDEVVITAGFTKDNAKVFGFGSGESTEVVRRCDYASNINDGSEVIPGTVVTTSNYDVVVSPSVNAPVVPTLEALKSALSSVNKVSADNSTLEEIVTLLNTIAGLFGAKDYVASAAE